MAPVPHFCRRRQRLVEKFVRAVIEHNDVQTAQIEGLIRGAGFSLEREIADALDRRDRAKYAILAHEEAHGCG